MVVINISTISADAMIVVRCIGGLFHY